MLCSYVANAQSLVANPCSDAELHNALVTINNNGVKQGKKLEFTNEMQLPNRALVPAAVTVTGTNCTVNFIADSRAKNCKITVLDQDKNVVLKEKFTGGKQQFTFKSKKDSKYIFVFSQRIKGKEAGCAAISILSQ